MLQGLALVFKLYTYFIMIFHFDGQTVKYCDGSIDVGSLFNLDRLHAAIVDIDVYGHVEKMGL